MAPTETKCVIIVNKTSEIKERRHESLKRGARMWQQNRRNRSQLKNEPSVLVALLVKKNKNKCLSVLLIR